MLIAVNYHYVRPSFDAPYPGLHGITPDQLAAQLRLLGAAGTFVSGQQLEDALNGEPLPPRAILVTFDDGLREQYECAWPVLCELGIPALFFINTRPIEECVVSTVHKIHLLRSRTAPQEFVRLLQRAACEQEVCLGEPGDIAAAISQYPYDDVEAARLKYLLNFQLTPAQRRRLVDSWFQDRFPGQEAAMSESLYMDKRQVKTLADHGCIGNHAHAHQPVGLLSATAAEEQIRLGLAYLEQWTGRRPAALSYPYGSRQACSKAAADAAARLGTRYAFTMERAGNYDLAAPLHLARYDCNDVPGGRACSLDADAWFRQVPAATWYRGVRTPA
jgi:peptidoglycan/xylan/chitin deacetylase (PgdA/CDA1 family)